MHKQVVLAQVGVDQAALLVQAANEQHSLLVQGRPAVFRGPRILCRTALIRINPLPDLGSHTQGCLVERSKLCTTHGSGGTVSA